ncbi:3D-(3,5/4)-trihydroxycyclohexane-1,2-dione acylhydrolase (decyclizing) [Tissierella sp. Yu-01]|uniref:3D-(3,5/4)-trihydroxycyclohexane-1,2-dione acylhydrolase (decyclizing) n=1 Tax=Tissierella sp. Yu-01 TaxID=3035694 RepID=UPI00240D241F|nr:3D-(3,5/4)-trihydroxycyclohexane-1,2-dione acylhydrolase (decyclizing) [Tissierella sp. Yu-01]WFA10121.1 3D-(3,5/4)-trihydroxycyclohexane-1,2-dione acylhydrolase (decyclizing) [Tissierella sp. Yu-01]
MKTIKLTVGQALMKFLDNQYVEFDGVENKFVKGVFTIFGHGIVVGFGEALESYKGDIKVYQGRNEQGMAHAAIGYAKQKNRREIIACSSSIGPGALNLVTAAGTATANRIPLLLFPGDTFACRQPDPVLQQIEQPHNLNITANDAFKAVSKYWDRITRPEQLMSAMINAMRVLTDPAETGAVTICLSQDAEAEAYDYPVEFFRKRIHHINRRPPSSNEVKRVAEIIKNKKKPLLICGGGVTYSEAGEALLNFAEKFNIPIGETQAGKGIIDWNHPLNLGGIGVTGTKAANLAARDSDVIIAVGTRLGDFTTSSKWAFQNEDVEIVSINVNSFDAYKMDSTMMVADAKEGLKALEELLTEYGYRSTYVNEIKELRADWNNEVDRLYSIELENGFSQTRALGIINEFIDESSVVVGSSGSLPGDLQRVWRTKGYKNYHMEYGFSCMGYEVCASLGVKIAEPEKEIYAMVGDGSYLMLHSELVTSIQEGKKINVILFDNNGFGCINNLQVGQGIPSFNTEFRYRNPETERLDGDYIPMDFAKSAEGYGVKTFRATNSEELREALIAAKNEKRSTLIDIKVLPKTMTDGYESWWRVGVPEISDYASVNEAYKNMEEGISKTKKF